MSVATNELSGTLVGRVVMRHERFARVEEPLSPEYFALPLGELKALHMASHAAVEYDGTVVEYLWALARLGRAEDGYALSELSNELVRTGAASLLVGGLY